jgi:RND family efflux transporter MFP subunit
MRIDQTDYALSLVAQVQAVNAARAKSVQASADEERYRKLVGTGAISAQTYEQAKAGADSARADLSAAEAQEAIVKNQAEYSVLKADAGGVIIQTLAEPGQVVSAGQVVVKLAHTGPREAIVYLPENVRPAIGSLAMVTLYGSSSEISWAHLRQLSDAADPQSRTYEARYVLEGDAARAPLGATATIEIAANQSDRLSEVPLGAIYDNGKGQGVWVINPKTSSVAFRPVRLRELGEETATISGGVRVGEQIVALGAAFLHQGAKVRVENVRTASQ